LEKLFYRTILAIVLKDAADRGDKKVIEDLNKAIDQFVK